MAILPNTEVCLSDELYDFYNDSQDSKSLWEALQKKYDTEEAGSKKYVVSKYFRFNMVDEMTVISQTHELQKLVHDILAEGMIISEQFQVIAVIDKLPPSWKNFRNSLLHKSKELSMESLLVHLRIEEENRNQDKKEENVSNLNAISVFQSPNQKPQVNLKPKKKSMKMKQNQNRGYIFRMCRQKKSAQVSQANVTEESLVAMITEVNAVGGTIGGGLTQGLLVMCVMTEVGSRLMHLLKVQKSEVLKMFKEYLLEVENQFHMKIKRLRSDRGGVYESLEFTDFVKSLGIIHETTEVHPIADPVDPMIAIQEMLKNLTRDMASMKEEMTHLKAQSTDKAPSSREPIPQFPQVASSDSNRPTVSPFEINLEDGQYAEEYCVPMVSKEKEMSDKLEKEMYNKFRKLAQDVENMKFQGPKKFDISELMIPLEAILPPKFKTPDYDKYDGTGCPRSHVGWLIKLSQQHGLNPEQMAQLFPVSLVGIAKQWRLIKDNKIELPEQRVLPNPLAKNWRKDLFCAYHRGSGHTTDKYYTLKHKVQDMIDEDELTIEEPFDTHVVLPPASINVISIEGPILDPASLIHPISETPLVPSNTRSMQHLSIKCDSAPKQLVDMGTVTEEASVQSLILDRYVDLHNGKKPYIAPKEVNSVGPSRQPLKKPLIAPREVKNVGPSRQPLKKPVVEDEKRGQKWEREFTQMPCSLIVIMKKWNRIEKDSSALAEIYPFVNQTLERTIQPRRDPVTYVTPEPNKLKGKEKMSEFEYLENVEAENVLSPTDVGNKTKSLLMQNFDMKDLGEANVILGIKITRYENDISVDKSHYIERILKKYKYFDCKPVCTPFDPRIRLYANDGDSVNQKEYASIIGSLKYATDRTRPDIAYVVGLLCRYTSCPSIEHWNAISRVMRYLKRTITNGIHFQRFPAVLEGFNDADWNTLSEDSKSTTDYVFTIGGGAVSWRSKKQTIIAQSAMESELIALTSACEETT
ncbi:uncharacterized protein LOC143892437 [Tasmannia lanceolata]|uniref:uncharacterized protein LOC143892437 n=1 Tax=Tasmannia lanceolata TaxID=3420 RepID=UPI0040649988